MIRSGWSRSYPMSGQIGENPNSVPGESQECSDDSSWMPDTSGTTSFKLCARIVSTAAAIFHSSTTIKTKGQDNLHTDRMATPDQEELDRASFVYLTGKNIHLKASLNETPNQEQTKLHVKVKQQKRPWTLSCGMVVNINDATDETGRLDSLRSQDEVFLKMFDRRFAEQIRQDNGIDTWSEDVEQEYLKGLVSGRVEEFQQKLRIVPNFQRDTEEDWDAAENEAYLDVELRRCFNSEFATYTRLQEYQGIIIPRLLAAVALDVSSPTLVLNTQQQELYQQKGVLLQYLPGFSLSTMAQNVPEASWQAIVDQAIRIVHILGDHDILNADVRPDNFIIVPNNDMYQVFMIDFGQCRFRREDESDAEWGRAKWTQDEEGAVGVVMRSRLKKLGFDLHFEPSWRYLAWAPGEDD